MAANTMVKLASQTARRMLLGSLGLLLVRVLTAKRRFSNAKLIWLLKRYLAGIIVRVIYIPTPALIRGAGSSAKVAEVLRKLRRHKPLIVTDTIIAKHGLLEACVDSLGTAGMQHEIFDGVEPDPHIDIVEHGHTIYKKAGCDSLVAVGGGSAMDCAKMIGVKVGNPKDLPDYEGVFKCTTFGLRPMSPLIAVPTTAGTGSEVSAAAVISDKKEHRKFLILDPNIVPSYAVLDPKLLLKLPKSVTAATGMDALTHAIEAYLNGIGTSKSRKNSVSSTKKVFNSLLKSYHNGLDCQAREEMLDAAFEAGIAIGNGHVGNVHAIAHQLGTIFHVPHGVANAMVLPHMLDLYLRDENHSCYVWCVERLCDLAKAGGIASSSLGVDIKTKGEVARKFVATIRDMIAEMDMPVTVPEMTTADVNEVAKRALAEAHGYVKPLLSLTYWCDLGYPVPMYMNHEDCAEIVAKLLPPDEKKLWKA